MDRALNEGEPYSLELTMVHSNGHFLHTSTRGDIVKSDDGRVAKLFGTVQDITEHKQAERLLKESEEKFRLLVEQSPLSIQIMNPDGQISAVNQAWADLWGFTNDAVREVVASYNMLEDEHAKSLGVMPLIERAFKGESVVLPVIEYDVNSTIRALGLNSKGKKLWVRFRFYPVKNNLGDIVSVVSIEENITEQKRAEEQVREHQERLRALAAELTLTEERERRRIATELHDQAAQSLALARIQLAPLISSVTDGSVLKDLSDLSQLLKKTLQQIREVMLELSSPELDELGLGAALSEWLEERVGRQHGLRTSFDDRAGTLPMTDDVRAVLFRNARELLMNTIKHAKASEVSLCIDTSGEMLQITVEDDGVGFDPVAVAQRSNSAGSFGLFSIHERMNDMGGALDIDSGRGRGTKATLTAPLKKSGGPGRT